LLLPVWTILTFEGRAHKPARANNSVSIQSPCVAALDDRIGRRNVVVPKQVKPDAL
jgi:hypothetical protein